MGSPTVLAPEQPRDHGPLYRGARVSAYWIERLIGSGGMGWVYRARHVLDEHRAAIKVLREDHDLAIDPASLPAGSAGRTRAPAVMRMMREATFLASIGHAGVPQLFECGLFDRRPWLAMELIEGTSLTDVMAKRPLSVDQIIELVADIANVLAAAHFRGVAHRDLKPDNILVTPGSVRYPLRIVDWGIADCVDAVWQVSHDETIGTPAYMAPEQARGGQLDGRCDVYSLGVLAYEALTGRPPFMGATSVAILVQHLNRPAPALAPRCPDAPAALVALVERMLAKHADARPTAREVELALRGMVTPRARQDAN
jgi:serine/threonine-protein kinase